MSRTKRVSLVEATHYMFNGAVNFNQALDKWQVGKVKSMNGMFENAFLFNQNIDSWQLGCATTMRNIYVLKRGWLRFRPATQLVGHSRSLKSGRFSVSSLVSPIRTERAGSFGVPRGIGMDAAPAS